MASVFVGNVSFSATVQDIESHFASAGTIIEVDIPVNAQNRSKGFAKVVFESEEDAANAIDLLNDTELLGRRLTVRADRGERPQKVFPKVAVTSKRLYIGNLPFSVSVQNMSEFLSDFGKVESCVIPVDNLNRSKGYCLVEMASFADAKAVQENVHGADLQGRLLDVRDDKEVGDEENEADDEDGNQNLFIGNLAYSVEWQDLKDLFGTEGRVIRANVVQDASGRSKGYGQVLMASADGAKRAIDSLNGYELKGRQITVRFDQKVSENRNTRNSDRGSFKPEKRNSKNNGFQVFVGNLPFNMRWQELKDIFKENFSPIHASVATDPATHRSKGHGLVSFETAEEAEAAVEEMNGVVINGRPLKVKLDKFSSQ